MNINTMGMEPLISRGVDLGGNVGGTEKDPLPPSLPSLPRLPPLPLLPTLSLPSLRNRLPLVQLGGLGERCKLPSGVWGGAPAEIECGAF